MATTPSNPRGATNPSGQARPAAPQMVQIPVPATQYAAVMVAIGQTLAAQTAAAAQRVATTNPPTGGTTAPAANVTNPPTATNPPTGGAATPASGAATTTMATPATTTAKAKSKREWKPIAKLIGIALLVCTLLYIGIMIGSNGGQAQVVVGTTSVSTPRWPDLTSDLAAERKISADRQAEIDRLKAENQANIDLSIREQTRLKADIAMLASDNNALSGPGSAGEFRTKFEATKANIALITSNYEERLRSAEEQRAKEAKEHAEECNAHTQLLRDQSVAAIASKDVVIAQLRFQLNSDQLLLESYRATANGEMAHLGERVNVDVVAFAPRDASFEIYLDSGQRTAEGVAIVSTVTGTNNGLFPQPTGNFWTNTGLYTVSRKIKDVRTDSWGVLSESWRQFIGTAGELVYMNLNNEKVPGTDKLKFRPYTFARATIIIWTGSCTAVRANPRSNEIPLKNGSVVELPDGTLIEVQNHQPVPFQLASAR